MQQLIVAYFLNFFSHSLKKLVAYCTKSYNHLIIISVMKIKEVAKAVYM